jgi:hypothetical protein
MMDNRSDLESLLKYDFEFTDYLDEKEGKSE